jgi:hypothetical protein
VVKKERKEICPYERLGRKLGIDPKKLKEAGIFDDLKPYEPYKTVEKGVMDGEAPNPSPIPIVGGSEGEAPSEVPVPDATGALAALEAGEEGEAPEPAPGEAGLAETGEASGEAEEAGVPRPELHAGAPTPSEEGTTETSISAGAEGSKGKTNAPSPIREMGAQVPTPSLPSPAFPQAEGGESSEGQEQQAHKGEARKTVDAPLDFGPSERSRREVGTKRGKERSGAPPVRSGKGKKKMRNEEKRHKKRAEKMGIDRERSPEGEGETSKAGDRGERRSDVEGVAEGFKGLHPELRRKIIEAAKTGKKIKVCGEERCVWKDPEAVLKIIRRLPKIIAKKRGVKCIKVDVVRRERPELGIVEFVVICHYRCKEDIGICSTEYVIRLQVE